MVIFKLKIHFHLILLVGCFQTQKKVCKFDRYDFCEIGPGKLLNVSYIFIKPAGHGSVVEGRYEIFRNVEEIKASAKVIKCAQKELLDSCEYVTTINVPNICGYLAEKNTIMTPMVYNHHPPFTCPLRKGIMILSNGTFDPTLMNFFPLENYYWKVELSYLDAKTDEFLYKMCIEGQVVVYWE